MKELLTVGVAWMCCKGCLLYVLAPCITTENMTLLIEDKSISSAQSPSPTYFEGHCCLQHSLLLQVLWEGVKPKLLALTQCLLWAPFC